MCNNSKIMQIRSILLLLIILSFTISLFCNEADSLKSMPVKDSTRVITPHDVAYDEAPVILKYSEPELPKRCINIRSKEPITVILDVEILVDGTVGDVVVKDSVSTDSKMFRDMSIEAIKKCVFSPAKKDGKPIAVWIVFPITYKFEY